MKADPARADELFVVAAEMEVPEQRAAFLDRECGGDEALRERVEALLASHFEAGEFLSAAPLIDGPPGMLPDEAMAEEETEIVRMTAFSGKDEAPRNVSASLEQTRLKPEEAGERIGHTSCSSRSARAASARSGWPSRSSRCGGAWR